MSVSEKIVPNRTMAPFRYIGGKGNIAKKILPLIPPHQVYVEPFCGAASLLFHKEPSSCEVINDLNQDIINLFRILRDPEKSLLLEEKIRWTPYARDEFREALSYRDRKDLSDIDKAWGFFVRQNQGFSGKANTDGDWGRTFVSSRGMTNITSIWTLRQSLFEEWRKRLMRVQIDNVDALELIRFWDRPDTFFYLDPPYSPETWDGGFYAHEMDADFHHTLVSLILTVKGKVMLSGYDTPIYDSLTQAGWRKETCSTVAHMTKNADTSRPKRIEVIWMNYRRWEGFGRSFNQASQAETDPE